ncbi:MAG: hypothetical protein Ta2G_07400 [Termitinemataceae bacterium]|nr:MAG: hypothetical protein Ta2G_07400 [Termitinemataceae bacterium]
MKTSKTLKGVLGLVTTILVVLVLITACRGEESVIGEAPSAPPKVYDPKTSYPITVVAKLAQFVTEDSSGESLQIIDFPLDTAPEPTSSVSSAKKGTSITLTIPPLEEHRVSGGLTSVVAESGERAAINSQNKFTMPLGSVLVTIVYIKEADILRVPTYYGNALYSLDIAHGEVADGLPNPIVTPFPDDNTSSYYSAGIAYSGYPDVDITPLAVNGYAAVSWSFATASWNDTESNALQNTGDGVEYFQINAKVKPQVLVEYPTLNDIPLDIRGQTVPNTSPSKTVEEMYNAAVENVYHFRVVRANPTVDARLYSINISGVGEIYNDEDKSSVPNAPFGSSATDYAGVNFYAFPPFGSTEVLVVAETNDIGSKVKIDNGTYGVGSTSGEVVYAGGASTTQFTITVQAEDISKMKTYTITLVNEQSVYTAEAEGGLVYYEEDGDSGDISEIHSFYISSKDDIETGAQKTYHLTFSTETKPSSVEILVVGGGGAGGNFVPGRVDGKTGGGGAGGVIYSKSYTLGSSNDYIVKVGNGGGLGLDKGVNETFTLSGREQTIAASQKGGDSFFGISDTDQNRLVAPGGGGGANNNDGIKFYGGKGGSSGGSTEGNPRGDDAGSGSMPNLYTPLLDFYYGGSAQQPDGTVNDDFTPNTGMAWGHTGVVRTHRDGDLKHCSWTGGGAGSVPATLSRTGGYWQYGRDWGRGIKIDITGTEREYARSYLSGQGNPTAGPQQTGNGGGGGNGVNGAAGGSGVVIVKWVRRG